LAQLNVDADGVGSAHHSVERPLRQFASDDLTLISDSEGNETASGHCHGRDGFREMVSALLELDLLSFKAAKQIPKSIARDLFGEVRQ
jgi:hypothetical protein